MKKLLLPLFLVSSFCFGQEVSPVKVPATPTKEDCIPVSEICKPKPTPVKPKPAPAKPKAPKTKPAEKCPDVTCNCPESKVIKTTTTSPSQPHSLSLLIGKGPEAFYPVLEKREDEEEYKLFKDRGYLFGVEYEYQFSPNWAVGVGYMTNDTIFGKASYKWGNK